MDNALGAYAQALDIYGRRNGSASQAKDKAVLLSNRAEALLQSGQHKAAVIAVSEALTLWPGHAKSLRRQEKALKVSRARCVAPLEA